MFELTEPEYSKLVHTLTLTYPEGKSPDWLRKHRTRLIHETIMFPCCENEKRNWNGWCTSCNDPCI